MFRLSVLLLNSMSKLSVIHNRCTCKLVIKTLRLQTCMQTETNSCVLFYVLLFYSLLFSSEIILKQLFASGSVNIVNNPLDFVSGIIRQYSLRLRRIIVKYKVRIRYYITWASENNVSLLNICIS